jgi:hypothetical protein
MAEIPRNLFSSLSALGAKVKDNLFREREFPDLFVFSPPAPCGKATRNPRKTQPRPVLSSRQGEAGVGTHPARRFPGGAVSRAQRYTEQSMHIQCRREPLAANGCRRGLPV